MYSVDRNYYMAIASYIALHAGTKLLSGERIMDGLA
jgi:hypothetical protein